jgi:hypothetical protein
MQVLLVDTPEGTQVGTKRRTRSLTGVAMHFTSAITIVIPGSFAYTMAARGIGWMTAPIALPCVGVQPRAPSGKVFREEATARSCIRVVAHPEALLARVARHDADDGGPIVGIGAVALPLIGPSTWWGTGIARGRAFFPPRSGTVRRPQTPGITSMGAVLFRCVGTRWRNVCSGLRDIPNSRAQRAVGSPFAMPRSSRTSVAGR